MRKPSYQPPRSTSMPHSLSRMLPKLRLPPTSPPVNALAHPKVNRPATVQQPSIVKADPAGRAKKKK